MTWSGASSAQSDPPNVNPTHFWTYKLIDPVLFTAPITAADQFTDTPIPLTVDRLERLVNWVSKNGSPVEPDTLLHYTWWNVVEQLPMPRAVRVINQFGAYDVSVQNLEFMLVPAWKNEPQPGPPIANHYLCYRAFGFPGPAFSVQLIDEWRQDNQQPFEMEYLCNPCMKEHGGNIFPVVDSLTHLALYRIGPTSELFVPPIFDQFFQGTVPVRQTPYEYLLVPSEKIDVVTPARTSTWGRIKTLYR